MTSAHSERQTLPPMPKPVTRTVTTCPADRCDDGATETERLCVLKRGNQL
jgi:hypothetical protein